MLLIAAMEQRLVGLLTFEVFREHFGHEEADFTYNNNVMWTTWNQLCGGVGL